MWYIMGIIYMVCVEDWLIMFVYFMYFKFKFWNFFDENLVLDIFLNLIIEF